MLSYKFHDHTPFQGSSAAIKRPREITHFSFDAQHTCHPLSDKSIRFYYPPLFNVPNSPESLRIDLSRGFEDFNKHIDHVDLHLYALLDTLEAYERQASTKVDADIVTWRGMMTKILTAPFDQYGEFEMNATCFEGTMQVSRHRGNLVALLTTTRFIEENHAAKGAQNQVNNRRPPPVPQARMEYWGYKFETLSTLPRPWAECTREEIELRESEVTDNHAQYCSIVRTGIGNHSMILGGEVDAVAGEKPDDPNQAIPYVELKTTQDFKGNDRRAAGKFEAKLCRFWAQSFLLGVPKIVIGYRSEDGYLQRLEEWKTMEIPGFVKRQGMHSWDGNICINFAAAFLDFLRQHVTDGNWRIQRKRSAKEITLSKIDGDFDIVSSTFKQHRQAFESLKTGEEVRPAEG